YRRLWMGIRCLSERRREIIVKTIEGKSIKEIAEELNISINTVKNTKAKAIDELRSQATSSPLIMLL
ncbi:MAG: helix-turn-helix domain-containing protein, partial [Prevotella sp.]|nr:helix-turn-helix domain-containing protein [Prevotella sp.]